MGSSDALPGFEIGGIQVWPDADEPNTWRWLPNLPSAQTKADGRPQISLIASNATTILQLGVQWSAPQVVLDGLLAKIAKHENVNEDAAAKSKLTPAQVTVNHVALRVGAEGALEEVATSHPSDYLPFSGAMSATLTGPRAEAALAALEGKSGRMIVRYEVTVTTSNAAEAVLSGDVAKSLAKLAIPKTDAEAKAIIASLEKSGVLTWRRKANADASELLRTKTDDAAREKASMAIRSILADAASRKLDKAKLEGSARLAEPMAKNLTRDADVATWFTEGEGKKYIMRF
jgi:hypothetical protein